MIEKDTNRLTRMDLQKLSRNKYKIELFDGQPSICFSPKIKQQSVYPIIISLQLVLLNANHAVVSNCDVTLDRVNFSSAAYQ